MRCWPTSRAPRRCRRSSPRSSLYRELGAGGDFVRIYHAPWRWRWEEPSSAWRMLGHWGRLLLEAVDLEPERRHKIDAADRVAAARGSTDRAGSLDLSGLRAAFQGTNLVAWRVYQPFLEWVKHHPQEATTRLQALWRDPGPRGIDDFLAGLPVVAAAATGARLSIASFLLGAADAGAGQAYERFPI
jgi:hypothetical protein